MLEEIKQTFENIRNAIQERGVEVGECESPSTYPSRILSIGGSSGNSFLFVPVFKSSETKPSKPIAPISMSDPTNYPSGWSSPDGLTGKIWMTYTLVGTNYTYIPWTEPILVSGEGGSSNNLDYKAFVVYTTLPSQNVIPNKPQGGQWNVQQDTLIGTITSTTNSGGNCTWSTTNNNTDGVYVWCSIGTFGTNGNIVGSWNTPFCITSSLGSGESAPVDYELIDTHIDNAISEYQQGVDEHIAQVLENAQQDLENTATQLQQQIEDAQQLLQDIDGTGYSERLSDLEDYYEQVMTAIEGDGEEVVGLRNEMDAATASITSIAEWTGFDEDAPAANSVATRLSAAEGTITSVANSLTSDGQIINVVSELNSLEGTVSQKASKQYVDGEILTISQSIDTAAQQAATTVVNNQTAAEIVAKINADNTSSVGIKADKIILDGDTIVQNGKIKADLIDADNIVTKQLKTSDVSGEPVVIIANNEIKVFDANGNLRTHVHGNDLSDVTTQTSTSSQIVFTTDTNNIITYEQSPTLSGYSKVLGYFTVDQLSDRITLPSNTISFRITATTASSWMGSVNATGRVNIYAENQSTGDTYPFVLQDATLELSGTGESGQTVNGNGSCTWSEVIKDGTLATGLYKLILGLSITASSSNYFEKFNNHAISATVQTRIKTLTIIHQNTNISAFIEIGKNGLQWFNNSQNYVKIGAPVYDNGGITGGFEVKAGGSNNTYGLRVRPFSGIEKWDNSNNTWVAASL